VAHPKLHVTATTTTLARAKRALRAQLSEEIERALDDVDARGHRRIIFCNDGTLLLVEKIYGQWAYIIAGPDRPRASGRCLLGEKATRDEVVAYARRHAEQSYGGVRVEVQL
jgi:hypothetical protein